MNHEHFNAKLDPEYQRKLAEVMAALRPYNRSAMLRRMIDEFHNRYVTTRKVPPTLEPEVTFPQAGTHVK